MWESLHYATPTVTAVDDEQVVISFGGASSNSVRDLNEFCDASVITFQTQICIFLFSKCTVSSFVMLDNVIRI